MSKQDGPSVSSSSLAPHHAEARKESAWIDALRQATLGDYVVYGELGRGGMATVYLADDIHLDRKVAIKLMAPSLFYDEAMVQRFRREAKTAASLNHPHIIPIYAVRQSEDLLYFVMKWVDGRPLDGIIKDFQPLSIRLIEAVLAQVGGALNHAHRRGVIHRDVKPANILIDEEGWAIVTDFGIAKVLQSPGLTSDGNMVGTPFYMSPEQCRGGELTGAADQYSLGVVAYEMLTGRLPFVGESVMGVFNAHFSEAPPPLRELRPDCPEFLERLVMRMLAKRVEDRWPNLEAVCTELLSHGRPTVDEPVRGEMITLAKSGDRRLPAIGVPTSPVPLSRMPPLQSAPARSPRIRIILGVVGALTGVTVLALGFRAGRPAPTPQPGPASASPNIRSSLVIHGSDSAGPSPVTASLVLPSERPAPVRPTEALASRKRAVVPPTGPSRIAVPPLGTGDTTSIPGTTQRADSSTGEAAAPPRMGTVGVRSREKDTFLYINDDATPIALPLGIFLFRTVLLGEVRLRVTKIGCQEESATVTVKAKPDKRDTVWKNMTPACETPPPLE